MTRRGDTKGTHLRLVASGGERLPSPPETPANTQNQGVYPGGKVLYFARLRALSAQTSLGDVLSIMRGTDKSDTETAATLVASFSLVSTQVSFYTALLEPGKQTAAKLGANRPVDPDDIDSLPEKIDTALGITDLLRESLMRDSPGDNPDVCREIARSARNHTSELGGAIVTISSIIDPKLYPLLRTSIVVPVTHP